MDIKDIKAIFVLLLGARGSDSLEYRTNDYYTTYINVSYVNLQRRIFHTERSETGRYSTNGRIGLASGLAVIIQSKINPKNNISNDTSIEQMQEEDPDTGCSLPFINIFPKEPYIAVMKRGGCTFNTKVVNAVSAGAVGVLIYNNRHNEYLKTIQVTNDEVPVVFTFQHKGKELVNLVNKFKRVYIGLEEGSHCQYQGGNDSRSLYCTKYNAWNDLSGFLRNSEPSQNSSRSSSDEYNYQRRTSVLFVSVSFIVLMVISLAWLLFYYVQRFRFINAKDALERRIGRQARRALSQVELAVLEGKDGEDNECTVCLDAMVAGEEVRKLPCSHMFHQKCIDSWLLDKRKCPLCNLDIIKHFGLGGEEEEVEEGI